MRNTPTRSTAHSSSARQRIASRALDEDAAKSQVRRAPSQARPRTVLTSQAANALSGKLKRASPALRKAGIVIDWPTRHDGPKTIKITFTANQRQSRVDRPEQTNRPLEDSTSKYFKSLDKDQAADPHSSRTITREVPDDLDLVPSDRGPDDHGSSRTILCRSSAQPSSGSITLETKGNSSEKDGVGNPDDSCGPLSNSGSIYPDEPFLDGGDDDDDWRKGGSGIL